MVISRALQFYLRGVLENFVFNTIINQRIRLFVVYAFAYSQFHPEPLNKGTNRETTLHGGQMMRTRGQNKMIPPVILGRIGKQDC